MEPHIPGGTDLWNNLYSRRNVDPVTSGQVRRVGNEFNKGDFTERVVESVPFPVSDQKTQTRVRGEGETSVPRRNRDYGVLLGRATVWGRKVMDVVRSLD